MQLSKRSCVLCHTQLQRAASTRSKTFSAILWHASCCTSIISATPSSTAYFNQIRCVFSRSLKSCQHVKETEQSKVQHRPYPQFRLIKLIIQFVFMSDCLKISVIILVQFRERLCQMSFNKLFDQQNPQHQWIKCTILAVQEETVQIRVLLNYFIVGFTQLFIFYFLIF